MLQKASEQQYLNNETTITKSHKKQQNILEILYKS